MAGAKAGRKLGADPCPVNAQGRAGIEPYARAALNFPFGGGVYAALNKDMAFTTPGC